MNKRKARMKAIVQFAQMLKQKNDNPFELAKDFDYIVTYLSDPKKILTARTGKRDNRQLIILNKEIDLKSQIALCAHELGHIILHNNDGKSPFPYRFMGNDQEKEQEANLFAIAYLLDKESLSELPMDITDMSNYALETLLIKLMK